MGIAGLFLNVNFQKGSKYNLSFGMQDVWSNVIRISPHEPECF
jgi:hypothetical protein